MLTLLFESSYRFWLFGDKDNPTRFYKDFDKKMGSIGIQKKLKSTLRAIDSAPLTWSHKEKFKPLEGEKRVWEIKIKPHRIACIWYPHKPLNLIGFYYCKKGGQKWQQKDINAMRIAKEQLYNK